MYFGVVGFYNCVSTPAFFTWIKMKIKTKNLCHLYYILLFWSLSKVWGWINRGNSGCGRNSGNSNTPSASDYRLSCFAVIHEVDRRRSNIPRSRSLEHDISFSEKKGKNIVIWKEKNTKTIPYRTKSFIGINVREISDCQSRKKFKPAKTYFQQVLVAWKQHWRW